MSKISKFLKLDKNLLLEYIYDSNNLINEPYDILVNSRSSNNSYLSSESSGVSNLQENSLFTNSSCSFKSNLLPVLIAKLLAKLLDIISSWLKLVSGISFLILV